MMHPNEKKKIRFKIATRLAEAHISASRDARLDSAESIAELAVKRTDALIERLGGL